MLPMDPTTVHLPLIDEASLHAALQIAPHGGPWQVVSRSRVQGTGWDLELQVWESGEERQHVAMRGPTVTGLSDGELEAERQRLLRIRDAAQEALDAVEGHLRYRRGLR